MAGISGLGTTYNLPNYTGELIGLTPAETPLLSSIGGLTGGGRQSTATEFEWEFYDLRSAAQNVKVEGAAAPTAESRVRSNVTNVTQIHQEKVSISYTKAGATGQLAGVAGGGMNPVGNELDWQVTQMLKQIARDVEYSFINGAYNKPADNATARSTRGLGEAITTNAIDGAAGALTIDMIEDLLQSVYDSGGISEQATATLMCNSFQKRAISSLYAEAYGKFQESSRTVGGVNVSTVVTNFGTLNVMLNRFVATDDLFVVSLEQLAPVFLEVPGKGHMFAEPLAKTGSSDDVQLYGEVGLAYGNEKSHGRITNLIDA